MDELSGWMVVGESGPELTRFTNQANLVTMRELKAMLERDEIENLALLLRATHTPEQIRRLFDLLGDLESC